MKLCIPACAPNGLESLIEPHLPRAEHLLFFDTETRLCEEISLREQPAGAGDHLQINAVLCGSINRVTLRTLIEQGIKVYGTEAQTVAQAIAQYENGELEAVGVEAGGCAGNGHEAGGCCSGQTHDEAAGEHHCRSEGGGCGGQGKGRSHGHGHEGGGCCGGHGHKHDAVLERP